MNSNSLEKSASEKKIISCTGISLNCLGIPNLNALGMFSYLNTKSKDWVGRYYFPSLIWTLVLGVLVPSRLGILGPQHLSPGLVGQVGEGGDGCPGWWWCVTMQWSCGNDDDDDDPYRMLMRMAHVCE